MRLPRVRFTVRRLMVIVAIAGVLSGGGILLRRSISFAGIAKYHASREAIFRAKYQETEDRYRTFLNDPSYHFKEDLGKNHIEGEIAKAKLLWPQIREFSRKHPNACLDISCTSAESFWRASAWASFHATLAKRYERATRNPWLLVAPDPPEPE
jgi:hypothetical protein